MKIEMTGPEIEAVLLKWVNEKFTTQFNAVRWDGSSYTRPRNATFEAVPPDAVKETD